MADHDIATQLPVVDKRRGRGTTGTTNQLAEFANYATIGAKRARLTALAPGSYTAARLAAMTDNDLNYALRLASADAAGI